jgi:cytochrome c biogenesis protein CcdA
MDSVFPDLMYGGITGYQRRFTVALADFVLALFVLLGTLLIPFLIMCQLLRLKRRAVRVAAERDGHT